MGARTDYLHKIRCKSLVQTWLVLSENPLLKYVQPQYTDPTHSCRHPWAGHIPNLVLKEALGDFTGRITDRAVYYFGAGSTELEISIFS